jgi:RES domain-containing protein
MPRAWRIVKTRYQDHAFTGEGARLYGGRWTSPGVRAVYASSSLSLATLEILVHLQSSGPLVSYSVCTVDFSEALLEELDVRALPKNWREYPAPVELQRLGDGWIRGETSAVLKVPSVVVPGEHNYLFNPAHPDFPGLRFSRPEPFDMDPRLLWRSAE